MLITVRPFKMNQITTFRKDSQEDNKALKHLLENHYFNDGSDGQFQKAIWYEVLSFDDEGNSSRIGIVTGYHLYGRKIGFTWLKCTINEVYYEFECCDLLTKFLEEYDRHIDDDMYFITSFAIKEEFVNNHQVINDILDMIIESNYRIYNLNEKKIIMPIVKENQHDEIKDEELEGLSFIADELFTSELGFKCVINESYYLVKDIENFDPKEVFMF